MMFLKSLRFAQLLGFPHAQSDLYSRVTCVPVKGSREGEA